jgi:hypothetical protein
MKTVCLGFAGNDGQTFIGVDESDETKMGQVPGTDEEYRVLLVKAFPWLGATGSASL